MKTPFAVVNAYKANDKETQEPIVVIQWFRQANTPVKFPNQFVFSVEEFEQLFDWYYDYDKYCLGISWILFEAQYKATYTDISLLLEE